MFPYRSIEDHSRGISLQFAHSESDDDAAVPVAMRHPRVKRDTVVLDGMEATDASLRARAFRAVGGWRLAQHRERLLGGLEDTAAPCHFEAAYALSLLGDAAGAMRLGAELEQLEGSTLRRAMLAWAVAAPSRELLPCSTRWQKRGPGTAS